MCFTTVDIDHPTVGPPADNLNVQQAAVPLRSCLKREDIDRSTPGTDSLLSWLRAKPSSSSNGTPPPKRVLFNIYVERRVITVSPVITSDMVSTFGQVLDTRSLEAAQVALAQLASVFYSSDQKDELIAGDGGENNEGCLLLRTYSLPYNQTIVVPLRPSHIKPNSDGEHNITLRFVAPEDMEDLKEGDLLPYEGGSLMRR